jgi:hypothetical protein
VTAGLETDSVSGDDVIDALITMYEMKPEDREKLGRYGSKHVKKNYSYDQYNKSWVQLLTNINKERGSWPTSGYQGWDLVEY